MIFKKYTENDQVTLKIYAESIYMHSISVISIYSTERIDISLSPELEIIQVTKGKRKVGNTIQSKKENDHNIIELSVMGLFDEKKVIPYKYDDKLGNHYGMRFYPFISSFIKGTICCSKKIDIISITIPDMFNFIFFQSEIKQNNTKSILRQSFGKDYSKYIFSWKDEVKVNSKNIIELNIPVRLGGRSILRIIQFPIYYWLAALTGIALLSLSSDKANIVIGAVVTAWLFMLQRWDSSSLPQKDTLLTKLYLVFGIILGLWGVAWIIIKMKAAILLVPIFIIVYITLKSVNYFILTGELPSCFATIYAKTIIKNDIRKELSSQKNKHNKDVRLSFFTTYIRHPIHS